jgi:hypothetical protein
MLLLAALVVAAAPGTRPHALAAGAGTISGTLVNGSHANQPVAGQTITLQQSVAHNKAQDVATTNTDAAGHFSFTGLDASGASVYALDTQFQGGDFGSQPITFDSGPAQQVTLTVWDTTSDDSTLSITTATLLFSAPNQPKGLIPVGEFVTLQNSGTRAFVGSFAPANGRPMGLLRFALPAGATNLTVGAGFAATQVVQVSTGFGATATVPPGTTQFAFVFDVPYTATDYVLHYSAEYPTRQVVLLVPTNMLTDAQSFTAKPPVQALGQSYQLLEADGVTPGKTLTMRLWDLPQPGEAPDLDFGQLLLLGGALALLLALLLGLYMRRGDLAVALRLVPAGSAVRAAARQPALADEPDVTRERKRLLKALLALEQRHAAGKITDDEYERERQQTRASLRALLAAQLPAEAQSVSAPVEAGAREAGAEGQAELTAADAQPKPRSAAGGRR